MRVSSAHSRPPPPPDGVIVADEGQARGPAFGDPRAVVLRWQVPPGTERMRADVYLTRKVGRITRALAQRLIARGDFRRAGEAIRPSTRLGAGDPVELWRLPPDEPMDEALAPAVLFEDERLLVLAKPSDLAVHPSARYLRRTVTAWLRARFGDRPPRPCHRLDRETSGVLLCAKDRAAEAALKTAFADATAKKRYLAVVRGHLQKPRFIDLPLALQGDRGLVKIRMIHDDEGLKSLTHVRPLAYDEAEDRTLVVAAPKTGRQHQIRAHLALIGYPLVGDKLYAMGDAFFDAFTRGERQGDDEALDHARHALHAYELCVPLDGERRTFRAPFPEDLAALLPSLSDTPLIAALRRGAPLP